MMPVYWFLICVLVNLFFYIFLSFYYFNLLMFFEGSLGGKKSVVSVSFLK